MKITNKLTAVVAAGCCLGAISSQATILAPGATGAAPDILALAPPGGGALTSTFLGPTLSGTVKSWSTVGNTFGANDVTLYYQIINTPGIDPVEGFTVGGFNGLTLDVGYIAGAGTAPTTVDRSTFFVGGGDVVSFDFPSGGAIGAIPVGGSSDILVVETSYHGNGGTTVAGLIDSSGASATVLAVPEPTTMVAGAMLLLPFGISTLRTLRRKSAE